MSINRKMRRASAKSGGPERLQTPQPVRYPQVRAALDMAGRLRDQRRTAEAFDLCQRVLPIEPQHPEVHFTIATIHEAQGDLVKAAAAYRKVLELAPGFLPGLVNLAACLTETGAYAEALAIYDRGLKLAPDNPVIHQGLALALTQLRRHDLALAQYEFLASRRGDLFDLTELASARDRAGDPEGALKAYRQAVKLMANPAPLHVSMARVQQMQGNRAAASQHIEQALEADPNDGYAHLVKAVYYTDADEIDGEIERIRQALAATSSRPVDIAASPLNFALGRLLERRGDTAAAFEAYATANRLLAPLQVNDDGQVQANVRQRLATFGPDRLKELSRYGDPTSQPLFILGMPRSGTTLVEQMLASHRDVMGLGELELLPNLAAGLAQPSPQAIADAARLYLQTFPAKARTARRVIDKSIGSFKHIELILLMFPNACLIACERHPMDIAWSMFIEYFNKDSIVYSYDLKRIAHHLRLHCEIMDHWDKVLPGRILTVRYEELVADSEAQARRLIEHAGLDWDPQILNFHESRRVVRTASLEQVRRPIYKSSVGKWRKFQPHLQALSQDLADLIDRYENSGQ